MRRRLLVVAAMVVGLATVSAPAALATPPVIVPMDFTGTAPVSDLCAFTVTVDWHVVGTSTFHFDQKGVLIAEEDHWYEVDSFSAKGTTFVGDGERFNQRWTFDGAGNVLSDVVSGQVESVTLPDETRFYSAGRVNFLNHPSGFVFTPDSGHSGNVDALCAAF